MISSPDALSIYILICSPLNRDLSESLVDDPNKHSDDATNESKKVTGVVTNQDYGSNATDEESPAETAARNRIHVNNRQWQQTSVGDLETQSRAIRHLLFLCHVIDRLGIHQFGRKCCQSKCWKCRHVDDYCVPVVGDGSLSVDSGGTTIISR